MIRVEVVCAWPHRHRSVALVLADAATVADAIQASGLPMEGISGYAVFGLRVDIADHLRDGDRLELLRPLQIDPKEARRRRAGERK